MGGTMTPEQETNAYNLLYLLRHLYHLHEARFYRACLSENNTVEAVIKTDEEMTLRLLITKARADYTWLVEHVDPKLVALPPMLEADPQHVTSVMRKLEGAIAKVAYEHPGPLPPRQVRSYKR